MTDLGVAIIGAGLMGQDHISRIEKRIVGATVTALIEPDNERLKQAKCLAPSARAFDKISKAIKDSSVDAYVIASPALLHEEALTEILLAKKPVFCEKPMTPDAVSAIRILDAEQNIGQKLIQVGFMRRFDAGYIELQNHIRSGHLGELITLHCAHRNASVPDNYLNEMLIYDSVVHEIDILRFLTDSSIASIEVKHLKRNKLNRDTLNDPILVILETLSGVTAIVEMNVSVQFGYQVKTEAVFQKGIVEIGRTSGSTTWQDGKYIGVENLDFRTRFAAAYDLQIQKWVNAARHGSIDGPSAWDAYLAAQVVEAGLRALHSGMREIVKYRDQPEFYMEIKEN